MGDEERVEKRVPKNMWDALTNIDQYLPKQTVNWWMISPLIWAPTIPLVASL
jgi:hypothetical protein